MIKLDVWDTAGQEKFRDITRGYYRVSAGVVLSFDLSDASTFANLGNWLHDIEGSAPPDICKILVGNKADKEERQVENDEAFQFALKNKLYYFETSAKLGHGVQEVFSKMAELVSQQEAKKKRSSGKLQEK